MAGTIELQQASNSSISTSVPRDLKGKTARAALISTASQGANFILRMGSMMILARLLIPADFGLVGMATACTGFLELFRDAGLSQATIQRASISREQTSTLFWINVAAGAILAAFCAAIAPILAVFYHEPRVVWVTVVIGTGFVMSGAAAQHRAVLMREMRFAVLATIDVGSLFVGIAVCIGMALAGQGYWALVGLMVCQNIVNALGVWIAGGWIPGPPRRRVGTRSMLKYGGTLTLNSVLVYIAYNADKVLLGRFWGAEILGIYGRAYQFINIPTSNLNTCIGQVAFPALSRLQNEPERLRSYFLKGYGLYLSLVMPITLACALFAEDIIRVFFGPNWGQAAPVFRLLAPTIVAFALINPFGWFIQAIGRATRSLKIAALLMPVVILGYVVGLPYGAVGVATGFSAVAVALVVPVIFWARHGTPVSMIDMLRAIMPPLISVLVGTAAALAGWSLIRFLDSPLLRLISANTILFGVYGIVLWFVMGQGDVYLRLIRDMGILPFAGQRRKSVMGAGMTKPQASEQ
jgi:O-antigen/teichoic acid export membrane protein